MRVILLLAVLLSTFGADVASARSIACDPPKLDDWQFSVEHVESARFALFLSEIAENYLGKVIFDSLADRFSNIPGIESIEHQDRESFLIESSTLTAEQLHKALWETFAVAAAEACANG